MAETNAAVDVLTDPDLMRLLAPHTTDARDVTGYGCFPTYLLRCGDHSFWKEFRPHIPCLMFLCKDVHRVALEAYRECGYASFRIQRVEYRLVPSIPPSVEWYVDDDGEPASRLAPVRLHLAWEVRLTSETYGRLIGGTVLACDLWVRASDAVRTAQTILERNRSTAASMTAAIRTAVMEDAIHAFRLLYGGVSEWSELDAHLRDIEVLCNSMSLLGHVVAMLPALEALRDAEAMWRMRSRILGQRRILRLCTNA